MNVNSEEIKYFFEKNQHEINKSKDKLLYVDFKEFFMKFNDEGEKIIEQPKTIIPIISDIASRWREDEQPIKLIFKNIQSDKVNLSGLKKKYIGKLIKLECYVKFKSHVYAKDSRVKYICQECELPSNNKDKCQTCGSRKFNEEKDFNDNFTVLVEEDPSELSSEQRPQSKYAFFSEHLIPRYNEIYQGARIRLYAIPFLRQKKKVNEYCLEIHNFEVIKDGIEIITPTEQEKKYLLEESKKKTFFKKCLSLFSKTFMVWKT